MWTCKITHEGLNRQDNYIIRQKYLRIYDITYI